MEDTARPSNGEHYHIDHAWQGQEACARLTRAMRDQQPYSLVIIDVRMPPGWDGVQTALHLLYQHPFTEILFISEENDYVWDDLLSRTETSSNLPQLKKPLKQQPLRKQVNNLIRKWNLLRESEAISPTKDPRLHTLKALNALLNNESSYPRASFDGYDELTGLPEMLYFQDRIDHALKRTQRHTQKLGILLLEIERFSVIEEQSGRDISNTLLFEMGERISRCIREYNTVSRMGQHRFGILIDALDNSQHLADIAVRIQEYSQKDFILNKEQISVSCCIGYAYSPEHGTSNEELIHHAELALHKTGKNDNGSIVAYKIPTAY
jgi:diguanylate cyclase (GGDEF)-like protein